MSRRELIAAIEALDGPEARTSAALSHVSQAAWMLEKVVKG